MAKWLWVTAAALCLALAGASLGVYAAWQSLHDEMEVPEEGMLFDVPSGTPLAAVARRLDERGVLERPWALTWYARLRGDATRIHAGEYRLSPGTTPVELLETLVAGNVYLHQLTVVEGWRYRDLRAALQAHPAVDARGLGDAEIMETLGKPDVHPEGQFLPDTYRFAKGTSETDLLGVAHAALESALDAAWAERAADIQIDSAYEALILASIIEKETALASERPLISGVFHRRLARGMRLQTDPTVIYGLGNDFDGDLRRRDLTDDTPYNTYTRRGLPPTPIALPSAASIDAAVKPAEGDALYFVATGRGDGSHTFSATLEEHNDAVGAYLQRLRDDRVR